LTSNYFVLAKRIEDTLHVIAVALGRHHRLNVKRGCAATIALVALLALACTEPGAVPTLSWYVNPDNGGQAALAARCSAASSGAYRIEVSVLPNDATQQREQLVRRLAAEDSSVDLMSLDPPFIAELAAAGFLRPFSDDEAADLVADVLAGPLAAARWDGRLYAAPFWANTQLLWFRRSVVHRAGLDPERPITWEELIGAAAATGSHVDVQARRYEGYMVWINALVASAGGAILRDPEAGKEARPGLDSQAGRLAAAVIRDLARSPAANPALDVSDEESARAGFQGEKGGFMVNWPYVYGAAAEAVAAGTLSRAVLEDIGWARYPRVVADRESRPPLGGIAIGVNRFSRQSELAVRAIRCITSHESQRTYMLEAKLPAARSSVYLDLEVARAFPMAGLIRDSIDGSAPRPLTPYYPDVSASVVRAFHPPDAVDPETTPAAAGELVVEVLHDRVLL
jgi:multiple sugar transport system substrate-binding protein